MTTGMSAAPIGTTSKNPNNSARPTMRKKTAAALGTNIRKTRLPTITPSSMKLEAFCPGR